MAGGQGQQLQPGEYCRRERQGVQCSLLPMTIFIGVRCRDQLQSCSIASQPPAHFETPQAYAQTH